MRIMQNELRHYLNGYTIMESEYCVDRVRARKHRKKRIDKKWHKRYGYKDIPKKEVYITADRVIIGHPILIRKIVEGMKKDNGL